MEFFLSSCLLVLILGVTQYASALDHHVAEVYFLVEPKVVRNYKKFGYSEAQAKTEIEGDLKYFVFESNKLYESLSRYDLYLEIRTVGVKFAEHEVFRYRDITLNKYLDSSTAIKRFKEWIKDEKLQDSYSYDIAIVLTGYDVTSKGNDDVAGSATVEAACVEGSNVGVVEFSGSMSTVITLTHELAHSLGAFHDGDDNWCSSSDGYIMSPVSSARSLNRWRFSSCSEYYIAKYIKKLNRKKTNCLKKTKAPASTFSLKDEKDRDIMNRDKVCERERLNPKAYFCHSENLYKKEVKGDIVCQIMWCGESGSSCWLGMPSEGMVCDVGKRCAKGKCVTAPVDFPAPSNLNPECLWNDTKTTQLYSNFYGGCQDYIKYKGAKYCYDSVFQHRCCYSCGKHETGVKGCEYGDKNRSCKYHTPKRICFGSQLDSCCHTCKDYLDK